MGADTKIEWARHTFNPWIGCTKVTAACDFCYAEERMANRLKTVEWGPHGDRKRTTHQYWREPLKWNSDALALGERPFVFCASLADVFDNQVPSAWRADLFELIRATPQLVWLLLTKRPQNILKMVADLPPNVALGASCGDQTDANRNVPELLHVSEEMWRRKTYPAFTFLSCEPLLGPIDLTAFQNVPGGEYFTDALSGRVWMKAGTNRIPGTSHIVGDRDYVGLCHRINWIIAGGESGRHARPMHPDWARDLRDQCNHAAVPFLFKQWGEYLPEGQLDATRFQWAPGQDGRVHWWQSEPASGQPLPDAACSIRIGKAKAGRLLDGREHNDMPRAA
jgi:protein gp37